MYTKCKNPLIRHTKPCTIFWKLVDDFNESVVQLEYDVNRIEKQVLHNEPFFDDKEIEGDPQANLLSDSN